MKIFDPIRGFLANQTFVVANTGIGGAIPDGGVESRPFRAEEIDLLGEYDPTTGIFTPKQTRYYVVQSYILAYGEGADGPAYLDMLVYSSGPTKVWNAEDFEGTEFRFINLTAALELEGGEQYFFRIVNYIGSTLSYVGGSEYGRITIFSLPYL